MRRKDKTASAVSAITSFLSMVENTVTNLSEFTVNFVLEQEKGKTNVPVLGDTRKPDAKYEFIINKYLELGEKCTHTH